MSVIWEPWAPAVGDRVQIRATTECPTYDEGIEDDGKVGVVVEVFTRGPNGHRFAVIAEDTAYGDFPYILYCAGELVPLTEREAS